MYVIRLLIGTSTDAGRLRHRRTDTGTNTGIDKGTGTCTDTETDVDIDIYTDYELYVDIGTDPLWVGS
jgi:hypothetical protein